MIVRLAGFDDDDVSIDNTDLGGHTDVTMAISSSGNGNTSGGAGYVLQPAVGDSGTANFSLNRSEEYRAVAISIAPQ